MAQHSHGAWIWELSKIRPDYLARLKQQNCQRVYLKVFDGRSRPMFWAHQCSKTLIEKFHQAGIEVYGWGFHYGTPNIEAQVSAVRKALDCGIDGYILDLEEHIKNRSTQDDVKRLIQALRPYVQPGTLGYTSFGHPGFHPEIPWRLLDDLCDLAFPQIYFEKWGFGTDEVEVKAALDAHKKLGLKKPILPIWGSEEDATKPAPAATLQRFLDRYPGSSVFRVPNIGQQGVAWNLNYGGETLPTPTNPLTTTEKPTKALFRMQLEDTTGLVVGHLFLFDANNKQIFDAVATSGLPGYQSADDLWKRAQGPIPDLAGIELSTEGTTIESREVNGLFFPVLPYIFENFSTGDTRGGFGVYNDAGNPGTGGGIGIINPNTYDRFCALMENARKAGVSKMPLKVEYGGRSRAPVKPARALFKMQLANTSRMVTGHIFLFDANGKQIFDAVATSGLPGTQGADDLWKPGRGPIPKVKGFTINTAGIYMPKKRGVNGWFFPIAPFMVTGPNGVKRGDFGVHFDANVPGSQGCIAIQNKRSFDRFRDVMVAARSAGVKQIPLEIQYPGTRSTPAIGRSRNQPKGISIHIGINRVDEHHYQGWSGQLNAAENDARAMQAIADQQGFASQVFLTEQATCTRVRDAIAQAARELESGDILLLTYAGHGGQIPDFNNDEVDKLDETWVLYNRELLDDELNALFAQFKPGVRILVISDSCYSGSATRTPYRALFSTEPITGFTPEWSDTMRTTERPKVRAMPQEIKYKTYYANHGLYRTIQKSTRAGDPDAIGASVILLSACQENQQAQENLEHGDFTQALLKVWNQGPFTDSYFEFYRAIVRLMQSSQSPDYRYTPGTLDVNFDREIPFVINFGDSDASEEANWGDFPETDWDNAPELGSTNGCGAEKNLDLSEDFVQLEA